MLLSILAAQRKELVPGQAAIHTLLSTVFLAKRLRTFQGRVKHEPRPPVWPGQYQVFFTVDVPYVNKLQSTPLRYQYQAWQDEERGMQKIIRDGVETNIQVLGGGEAGGLEYIMQPRIDKLYCVTYPLGGGAGPTAQAQRRRLLQSNAAKLGMVLPEIGERWAYNGSTVVANGRHAGRVADVWVWRVDDEQGYGTYHNVYTFLAGRDGEPLALLMRGVNLYTGGHFDEYDAIFFAYKICPEEPDPAVRGVARHQRRYSSAALWRSLLPNRHYGDAAYDAFVHRHGRRHGSAEEYEGRRQVFHENWAKIGAWNADGSGHELGVNRFADWTQDEYEALVLPTHGSVPHPTLASARSARLHRPALAPAMLPATVDWRGTPADSPVKDQAACGSCWAFGSVASLEAAYFRETGKQLLLSEQNLMDCAWGYGNTACLGGFQSLAYNYMTDVLGIASEEAYPYKGVSDYCHADIPHAAKFANFSQVWVNATETHTQEQAVMDAILTKGPMTVSVNAEGEDFRFYKSGIYNNKKCSPKMKRLDHAVIVSGYGRTPEGQDYWIVKNTWSPYWGVGGYIYIARDPDHDCGIATQAIYTDLRVV
ncbi:hypothetical protein WJX81_000204 [Elliptochloris bilobata]|uniref:Uncharacterized protein n=1 Tax=Elliptochloris bilobata TaxID=381761 RepID=A0AAW1SL04_9CHLO